MKISKLLKTAIQASWASGEILSNSFGKKLSVREKKNAGLVTEIDEKAERAAVKILKKYSKEFAFLTEEKQHSFSEKSSHGRWIVDPLDGTTNFIHGFPMFCVSIAVEVEGELQAGVVYHPILKETYIAEKNKGSYLLQGKKKTKLQVSKTRQIKDSLLTTGFSYHPKTLSQEMLKFRNMSKEARAVRRPGSAALDLAYTARGVFDGFWEKNLSAWDIAAGHLLVEEAGGIVTDFSGKKRGLFPREILASNPSLHQKIVNALHSSSR